MERFLEALKVHKSIPNPDPKFEPANEDLSYLGNEAAKNVINLLKLCPAYKPTPLYSLKGAARVANVKAIYYKDEGERLNLKSFKALGGVFAIAKLIQNKLMAKGEVRPSLVDIFEGIYVDFAKTITLTTASAGNHGRSVAAGAKLFGCGCVIYLPKAVPDERADAIASFGAKVIKVNGSYEDAVALADKTADEQGWEVLADIAYDGYMDIPNDIMEGYGAIMDETQTQLIEAKTSLESLTHVFLQGGVGSFSSANIGQIVNRLGNKRPTITIVEPDTAGCIQKSIEMRKPTPLKIPPTSIMGGLSCAKISLTSWDILKKYADYFITISDNLVHPTMRVLASGEMGEKIIAGESGVASFAGAMAIALDERVRALHNINEKSILFTVGTEGATAPKEWSKVTGQEI
ncbi:MAG: diaminopropionate ammonia-lyase [Sphingomonadales bacterium]